ncbi:MAG: BlaI/MecI/CopY family transcriptional regulator [Ruminococcus sp.]|nr:BlaI/MecI/CopY family transcriptional regulator [Ruminococcus sp.]
MKRLPESELEIMMIIWKYDRPVNRMEIEEHLEKKVAAPTILSFLTRLEARGFVSVEKIGKVNWYTPLVKEEEYLQKESRNILRKMYQNSLKNFVTALYDGDGLTRQDIEDLRTFLEEKSAEPHRE